VDYLELTVGDFFKHAAVDIVNQPASDQEKHEPNYQHHKTKYETPQQHAFNKLPVHFAIPPNMIIFSVGTIRGSYYITNGDLPNYIFVSGSEYFIKRL